MEIQRTGKESERLHEPFLLCADFESSGTVCGIGQRVLAVSGPRQNSRGDIPGKPFFTVYIPAAGKAPPILAG
nr:hypothetical protein [uncultured Oscillibacter sp.]